MPVTIPFKKILLESIKLLFIILFVYTVTSKLLDFEHFKGQLEKSPYISRYADAIVWGLPLVESLIVGLFLFRRTQVMALYSSLFLMTVFTTYILMVLNFSDAIPCACGGVLASLGWKAHVIFNLAFMALAVLGISVSQKNGTPSNRLRSAGEG